MTINNHKTFCDQLVIDCQYQSINIDIDCHWLSISSIVLVTCFILLLTFTHMSSWGPIISLSKAKYLNTSEVLPTTTGTSSTTTTICHLCHSVNSVNYA